MSGLNAWSGFSRTISTQTDQVLFRMGQQETAAKLWAVRCEIHRVTSLRASRH